MHKDHLTQYIPPVIGGAVVLLFLIFKWSFLHLPLFWDEAWVYGPAARTMYTNGLSLLPDTIGTDLSRGHPLLFQFLAAAWMKLFGTSNAVMHGFALFISSLTMLATYWTGRTLGSPFIGLAALVLLALSEPFLAQSGILLPEVLLALFVLLTLLSYTERRVLATILFASAALLTKESALVLILSLLCWHGFSWATGIGNATRKARLRWTLILLAPLIAPLLFHGYQRWAYGWFFYPEHLGLISWDLRDIHYTFKLAYRDLFEHQGMEWATMAFGLLAPLAWRGWPQRWRPFVVVMLYITAIKVLDGKWALPPLLTMIVTLLCMGVIMVLQIVPLVRSDPKKGEFVGISMIFIWGLMTFSSINFFSDRYLICAVPLIALGFSTVLFSAFAERQWLLFPSVMTVIVILLYTGIGGDDRVGDTRLSYRDAIQVEQQLIRQCEALHLQDQEILCSFMERVYMTDPDAGYLAGMPFERTLSILSPATEHALVTSFASAGNKDPIQMEGTLEGKGFFVRNAVDRGKASGKLFSKAIRPE